MLTINPACFSTRRIFVDWHTCQVLQETIRRFTRPSQVDGRQKFPDVLVDGQYTDELSPAGDRGYWNFEGELSRFKELYRVAGLWNKYVIFCK
jgi:hypothetical protein